jgi:translation initiation factor IF-3
VSPVRLIDENDQMVGIIETEAALRRAREAGMDLVEVGANAAPPVVKIMDYGKWKYQQSKKDRASRTRSRTSEIKEVRLGRSMKIDPHDVGIRLEQARRFLIDGHKVQIVQNFRGREVQHKERGIQRMHEIRQQLADLSRVEIEPRLMGKRLTMILAPDRAKIEQLRRRLESGREAVPASAASGSGDDGELPGERPVEVAQGRPAAPAGAPG